MKRFIIYILLATLLLGSKTYSLDEINKSTHENINCFITISILGGYSGYLRQAIKLTDENEYIKAEYYSCSNTNCSHTEFNTDGHITGFTVPDQLRETRYIQQHQKSLLNEQISSLLKFESQNPDNFNAKDFSKDKGTCTNAGLWIHFSTTESELYLFGMEAEKKIGPILAILSEGRKKPKKMKNR